MILTQLTLGTLNKENCMKQFNKKVPERPEWTEYTMCNDNGITISVIDYGAIITEVLVPDKNGVAENIVLSMNRGDYNLYDKRSDLCFGAIVGRVAGRIGGASFTLNNKEYRLPMNNGKNCLHGNQEFNRALFKGREIKGEDFVGVLMEYESPDGTNGFPGKVKVTVKYSLWQDNRFTIKITGETNKPTILDITNHTYFNLSGNCKKSIKNQVLKAPVSFMTPLNSEQVPTGELKEVKGTPFDLNKGKRLSEGIKEIDGGFDHPFLFEKGKNRISLEDSETGRRLEIKTDAKGFVCYTAGCLNGDFEIGERKAEPFLGVALEMQNLPDAIHNSGFPSIECYPSAPFKREITWRF